MKQIESQYTSIKRKKKNSIHTHIAKKKKKIQISKRKTYFVLKL